MEDNFTHNILIVDDERLAREHVADMIASIIPEAELTKSDGEWKPALRPIS